MILNYAEFAGRADMKYPELSRGFRTFIRLEWTFTGLEWILLEIHRAVTKRGKFTGLE
jgi:hypothetical protein